MATLQIFRCCKFYGKQIQTPYGTPDPTAEFPQEIYFLDRKITENRDVVQWEAISALDLVNVKLPKRIATRDIFPGIGTFVG